MLLIVRFMNILIPCKICEQQEINEKRDQINQKIEKSLET